MSQQLQHGKHQRQSFLRRLRNRGGPNRLGDGARDADRTIPDDLQVGLDADNTGRGEKRNQSRSPPDQKPRGKRSSRRTKDPQDLSKEEIENDPRLLLYLQTELRSRPIVESDVNLEQTALNNRLQDLATAEGNKRAEAKRISEEADEIHKEGETTTIHIKRCSELKQRMGGLSDKYPLAAKPLKDIRSESGCVDLSALGEKSANKRANVLHKLLVGGICYNKETREFVLGVTDQHFVGVYVSTGLFEKGATPTHKVLKDIVGDSKLFRKGTLLTIRIAALLGIPHNDLVVSFDSNPKTSGGSPLGKLAKRLRFNAEADPEEQQPSAGQFEESEMESNEQHVDQAAEIQSNVDFEIQNYAKRMWDSDEVKQAMGGEQFPNPEALASLSFADCSLTSTAIDELFGRHLLSHASTRCLTNVIYVDARNILADQDRLSVTLTAKSMASKLSRFCPRVVTLILRNNPWNDNVRYFCENLPPLLEHLDLTKSSITALRPTLEAIGEKAKNMRTICMSKNQDLSEDCANALQVFLPNCLELTRFEIGGADTSKTTVDIGKAMATLPKPEKMENLKIDHCYIGSEKLASDVLSKCCNLQSLSMVGCVIPNVAHLVAVFRSIQRKPLQYIDFSYCLLGSSWGGVDEQKDETNKEELTIWGSLSDVTSLLDSVYDCFSFSGGRLKQLEMAGLYMNDYIALALVDAIRFCADLEHLDLAGNTALTKKTAKAIADAIKAGDLPALKLVDFRGTAMVSNNDEEEGSEIRGLFPDYVTVLVMDPEDD